MKPGCCILQPAWCDPGFHLQMKARRDSLPVICALAWCALINYAPSHREKKTCERNFLSVAFSRSRRRVSLVWSGSWFESKWPQVFLLLCFLSPCFLLLPCSHRSADLLIKEGWNQISSLLVNHMRIFLSLWFSRSSPSAKSCTDLIAHYFLFHAVSKWALSAS